MNFAFDNTYARELPGFYASINPAPAPAPSLLYFNAALAQELGLIDAAQVPLDEPARAAAAALFAGNTLPPGAQPLAQAYAGHQFGGFSPQLGDGRALLLGEVLDHQGRRRDIAFKGSGRTPFSRGGDGKAAVGPMLREVLVGEAMHALGVPTTRALAVAATGDTVYRERLLPGAVLTRVAASHLRVGTFQWAASRGDADRLRSLLAYTLRRHDPDLLAALDTPEAPMALLRAVAQRQARLLAQWMNLGFIHGVMNTDNMTISGETIDYGPCAFMEAYDPQAVFSSIDHGGRYAFANQPLIARWNLARLAEALLPLAADAEDEPAVQRAVQAATEVIDAFPAWYDGAWRAGQRAKLGLQHPAAGAEAGAAADADAALADDFLALLHTHRVDHTLAWRRLADAAEGDANPLRALFAEDPAAPGPWLQRWQARCALDDGIAGARAGAAATGDAARQRAARLRAANPFVIPRNHRVEEALAAASEQQDLQPFERLLAALQTPFDETPATAPYGVPAPAQVTAAYQTFCGT